MDIRVEKKDQQDIYTTPIVQQTAFWSEVKKNQGLTTRALDFKVRNRDIYTGVGGYSYTNADLLLVERPLDHETYIAYAPYGPEIEPSDENQGRFLEELSELIQPHLPKNCAAIRYDLNWRSHWHDDEVPVPVFQEFNMNYNTINWSLRKSNSGVLPATTIFLDLAPTEEEILKQMKPKTRYNIGLARRKGVSVRRAGLEQIGIWYELYKETALRNNLFVNNVEYFTSVISARADDTSSPAHVELLIAEVDNIPLAAMFLVLTAHRGTYLYGASSSRMRNFMPTYALQWEAIRLSKQAGCIEYDMFGVSPGPQASHPMHGLYQFKTGFGGEMFHHLGCWDYVFDQDKYRILQHSEMQIQGYYM
ncbi:MULTISPECIES: peptidoglycan bridge formation glycyltransferase FemA/FemB family protein [unclassified Parabacteroides]|uniref:lipid II:glycine glycyltransferase FemX n=1 Tax=unclassified Parabacteroides TaxID=2649774 RepID=UPI002473D195|nr:MULTISPECIES: peptidoglycan bridge formation glycyltransferase FemA/FemB family protein [unclassified Parabacteroides]